MNRLIWQGEAQIWQMNDGTLRVIEGVDPFNTKSVLLRIRSGWVYMSNKILDRLYINDDERFKGKRYKVVRDEKEGINKT